MFQGFEIRPMPLSLKSVRLEIEQFLQKNDLKLGRLDYYAGVYRDDILLAGGGLEEDVMKCFAVAEEARGLNIMSILVDHLHAIGASRGYKNFFIFTKPQNDVLFTSLAFNLIGKAQKAILLESNSHGISNFCEQLSLQKKEGKSGCIVMNCNPMTIGHRFLIESAAKQVDHLHIFVVSEDKSEFCSQERFEMVKQGTSHIPNVYVHNAGKYIISFATFPMYFFKNMDELMDTYIELDLDIFIKYIIPTLNISVRFVGSEPLDKLTLQYNNMMKKILPQNGIELIEIERMRFNDTPVSASLTRSFIHNFHLQTAYSLVPDTSKPFILRKCARYIARLATESLTEELKTTPKPGLIDKHDNGSHHDMDYRLMKKSIKTLSPYFYQFAELGLIQKKNICQNFIDKIKTIGINAETEMLQATNGVNTHRGAIFAMGLCIASVSLLISTEKEISAENIKATIIKIAKRFEMQENSHGSVVCKKYNLKGALANAQEGYTDVFDKILPVYQQLEESKSDQNSVNIQTLMYIMSILDDTNVYHRNGSTIADEVKKKSSEIYHNFDILKVEEMNQAFIRDNISPGGSADMLTITFFINKAIKLWLN